MSTQCDALMNNVGAGVAAALRAVDCSASEVSAAAFGRLFAPGGALGPVLTILLGLFIAFFAISLMLGRSSLSVRSLVPRMLTLGLVVTFATSWVAYQSVVWNLAIGAPDYLASVITGTQGSATTTFADKIDVALLAVQQASEAAGGQVEGGQAEDISAFSPQGILWLGAILLLLGTVGVLVTARIALALLVALGPIFVVMALFNSTRGLFAGWLKGLVMLALTPLLAVLGGGLMLELAIPLLTSLNQMPGQIDARAAMAFFIFGAVHVALMIMALKVSAAMIAGWRVFGLVPQEKVSGSAGESAAPVSPVIAAPTAPLTTAQAAGLSKPPGRMAPAAVLARDAANDPGTQPIDPSANRVTRVFATSSSSGQITPLSPAASRTNGVGSRFRSAGNRKSEKLS